MCLRIFVPDDQHAALCAEWVALSLTLVSRTNSDSKRIVNSKSKCRQSRAGNMTPQRLSVDSAKVARLVKYNAFGEGKHLLLIVNEDFHHSGEQKLNMKIVFCTIKLLGLKAPCCRS